MSIKSFISNLFRRDGSQEDSIHVELDPQDMTMTRKTDPEIPHEVTVVVPRAAIREKYNDNGQLIEKEILLNSITIVHAPRHPLAGPPAPPPEIPAQSQNQDHNFRRK